MSEQPFRFEEAFSRLEAILERMNSGGVPLDESLKLYEEADKLISACGNKLTAVETRIETLIKKRNGEIELDEKGEALCTAFEPQESV